MSHKYEWDSKVREYAWDWFVSKSSGKCIVCKSESLGVIKNHILLGREEDGKILVIPHIGIVCDDCHYMHIFDAVSMGLLPKEEECLNKLH